MSFLGKRHSYMGSGLLQVKDFGADAGYLSMSAQKTISIGFQTDEKRLQNTQRPGGGTRNIVRRINSGKMSVELMDFTAQNLAMAFLADVTNVAAGSITSGSPEIVKAHTGALVPLAHIGPSAVTVKDSTDTTTYVAGTDYEVWESGLYIPSGSTITDAADIHVAYTYGVQDVVEMIMNSGKEYSMIFSGLNEAESDLPGVLYVHRAKSSPASDWALLGDDFGTLKIDFELLPDTSKGAGQSQYSKWVQGQTA